MASLGPNELNVELNRERFSLKYFQIMDLYSICSKTFSARSREASKPRYWLLSWSYRFAIWRASRQRCCQGACQISELLEKSKYESHGFESSWDLAAARRPSVWWIGALMPYMYRPELVITIFPFFIDHQRAFSSTIQWSLLSVMTSEITGNLTVWSKFVQAYIKENIYACGFPEHRDQ